MTIQCQCSHCGASLKVKDKLAGTEGKCPKCRKTIHIPEAFSDDSEDAVLGVEQKPARPAAPQKSAQDEEEAAIFGDDFFSTDEKPARPRYVAPVAGPDVGAAAPKEKKPRSTESETGTSIDSGSGDNAASVASSLLSKTGKRNRPDEFKDPGKPENEGYDYSEVNYLLLNRILPAVSAAVVLFSFFYWMFSGMMGSGEELPELAGVTGYVTQNGAGIAAQVMFLPKPGSGRDGTSGSSSVGVSAPPDGAYEAYYKDDIRGVVLGEHEVQINAGVIRVTRDVTIVAGSQEINFEVEDQPAGGS